MAQADVTELLQVANELGGLFDDMLQNPEKISVPLQKYAELRNRAAILATRLRLYETPLADTVNAILVAFLLEASEAFSFTLESISDAMDPAMRQSLNMIYHSKIMLNIASRLAPLATAIIWAFTTGGEELMKSGEEG